MFSGIFAPIATPFEGGEISFRRMKENLARWGETGLAGVVVLGSNGEFVLLDEDEKERLVGFVRENLPASKKVIAGTGCESTRATVRLSKKARDLGADAVLVVTPSYYKGGMTDHALQDYYTAVANDSPCPVLLYNMPRNTGVNMSPSLVASLSSHPNIAGIKDSSGNIVQISEIIARSRPGFAVFAGSGSFLLATLLMGGVGGTLAVANVIPDVCVRIATMFSEGRIREARDLQMKILDLNAAVTSRWGVAGLKAALDMTGYFGGDPRPPLRPLPAPQRVELQDILTRTLDAVGHGR
ncbi:MAG: dihydrodipicolinate synthase family protein [Ignavibacteriales bacterium]